LPIGYEATVAAYRSATLQLEVGHLSGHYTQGLQFFRDTFVPYVKQTLRRLSGGAWNLDDYCAYAAGTDVDFMSHIIEAVVKDRTIAVYPGDWFGFQIGSSQPDKVRFTTESCGQLACICVPSVRNGHLTSPMTEFLGKAEKCLLNINLYPTLEPNERRTVAEALNPMLPKSILSISFSRGFALTASQLGLILVHRDHPLRIQLETQWEWFTYFFNLIAAKAFMNLDLEKIEQVNAARRVWVADWLRTRELPDVQSGSYYVRSFQLSGEPPDWLKPLVRDGFLRLCTKPAVY
jgi:hypothetical protein